MTEKLLGYLGSEEGSDAVDAAIRRADEMVEEYETWCEPDMICPYCGAKQSDAWEYLKGPEQEDDEYECDECGKIFIGSYETEVLWTTKKKQDGS